MLFTCDATYHNSETLTSTEFSIEVNLTQVEAEPFRAYKNRIIHETFVKSCKTCSHDK